MTFVRAKCQDGFCAQTYLSPSWFNCISDNKVSETTFSYLLILSSGQTSNIPTTYPSIESSGLFQPTNQKIPGKTVFCLLIHQNLISQPNQIFRWSTPHDSAPHDLEGDLQTGGPRPWRWTVTPIELGPNGVITTLLGVISYNITPGITWFLGPPCKTLPEFIWWCLNHPFERSFLVKTFLNSSKHSG